MNPLGVLLAAGPGTRLGQPGALMRGADGVPWVVRTVEVMRAAGCDPIGVVVGASSEEVVALLTDVVIVPNSTWPDGLSTSLRAGLTWALEQTSDLALVHMVNKPDVTTAVLTRVLTAAGTGPDAVARAALHDRASHPVVMGRNHWLPALTAAHGDRSAGPYLKRVPCPLIPYDDLIG